MKLRVLLISAACSSTLSLTAMALAQERSKADRLVRDTQISFIAKHEDGTSERVIVKYEAMLAHRVWQTGSSSKPLEGKIEDDRKCHLSLNARVYRRAYIVSHAGVQAPVESYQAIYQADSQTDRGPDNLFEALTRHVTCGDVNNFAAQISGAEAKLVDQFDSLVAKDDDKTRTRLRAMLQASSLELVT